MADSAPQETSSFTRAFLPGLILGLVVGKTVGVTVFSWLAIRLNVASLPAGVSFAHLLGGGAVAGIGFTVALFIARLAFGADEEAGAALADEAIMGVLIASILATVLGLVLLRFASSRPVGEMQS